MRRTSLLALVLIAGPASAQQPAMTRAGEVTISLTPAEIQLVVKGLDTETRNGGLAVAVNTVPLAHKLATAARQSSPDASRQQDRVAPPLPPASSDGPAKPSE